MAADRFGLDVVSSLPDPWAALSVELRGVLEDRGRTSRDVALRSISFRRWASLVPEARGPLDFGRFRYQRELYEEWAVSDREAVFAKGNQVGLSTWALRFSLYHADVYAHTVLLTMPTDRMLASFSRRRVRPVIRSSAHLLERIPARAVDSVDERQVGAGWLICRGTQAPIEEVNADAMVCDELDFSDQGNLEASERRVTGPDSAGLIRRISIPTVPNYGVSAAFDSSDQRVWTVKCKGCGEWNPMRGAEAFAANVDADRLALVCRKCRRRLDVQGAGEWVPTFPDRDVRGYHVPKLIVPGVRLDQLVANSRKSRPDQRQAFHNRDLGEPYAPEEHRLSIDQIRACVRDELRLLPSLRSERFVCMGVDVAGVRSLNVVIEEVMPDPNEGRRVFVGEVEDGPDGTAFEQLGALMDRYAVTLACIDRAPERRFSDAFAAAFPGRVWLVGYYTPQPGSRTDVLPWTVDEDARLVTLWRTFAIDATLDRFRRGVIHLPPLEQLPPEYPAQLGNVVRQNVEVAGGQVRPEYRSIGPDDYLHSEVYCLAAIELVWRHLGLARVLGHGAVPLAELTGGGEDEDVIDAFDVLAGDQPIYRPPFE